MTISMKYLMARLGAAGNKIAEGNGNEVYQKISKNGTKTVRSFNNGTPSKKVMIHHNQHNVRNILSTDYKSGQAKLRTIVPQHKNTGYFDITEGNGTYTRNFYGADGKNTMLFKDDTTSLLSKFKKYIKRVG